jgi:formyl-CoA transferase
MDPRFATVKDRHDNGDALWEEIAEWTRQHDKFEAMEMLAGNGVPCGAVYDTVDIFNDRHLNARNMVRTIHHPTAGDFQLLAPPVHMSESEVELIRAPLLGEHTAAILQHELGLSVADIHALAESGVLGLEQREAAVTTGV